MSESVARDQLRAIVERIERLEEEKKNIADDIKEIYGEAKANGFDTKALRKIVSMRKQDVNERLEQEAVLDTYLAALGMAGTPLGDYALTVSARDDASKPHVEQREAQGLDSGVAQDEPSLNDLTTKSIKPDPRQVDLEDLTPLIAQDGPDEDEVAVPAFLKRGRETVRDLEPA